MRTVNAITAPSFHSRLLYFTFLTALAIFPLVAIVHGWFSVSIAGILSVPQLVNGLLLVALFVLIGAVGSPAGRISPLFRPLLFLAFYCALISVAVSEPLLNLKEVVRMLFPCAVGMAAFVLAARGELDQRMLVRIAWWVLLVTIASQAAAYAMGTTLYESEFAVGDLSGSGASAVTVSMIGPFFFLSGEWRKREVLGVFLALISSCATMRRSGILAIFAALLVCIVCRIFKRRASTKNKVYSLWICIAVFLAFAYALTATGWGDGFSDRLSDMDVTAGGTGSGRTLLFALAWDHLLSRSAFAGMFGEGRNCMLELTRVAWGSRVGVDAHNEWLTVVLSFGLVGSVAYIVFHWKVVQLILRLRGSPLGLFEASAASLVVLVIVAVANGEAVTNPVGAPLFAILGYAAAIERRRHFPGGLGQRLVAKRGGYN